MKYLKFVLFAVLLISAPAFAQSEAKYLVPVSVFDPIPGAWNSVWDSILTAYNDDLEPVEVYPLYTASPCVEPCLTTIPARRSLEVTPAGALAPRSGPGTFLFIASDDADRISLRLRIQDLSRQSLTWGTELPVVSIEDALISKAQFLDVPTDERFRQMLRVYDFDSGSSMVTATIFDATGTLLAQRTLALVPAPGPPIAQQAHPSYAEIGWIANEFPEIAASPTVRIQVEPLTPGLRYWAFVSVTNNETQHVTIVTPK